MNSIFDHIPTHMTRQASTNGGEWAGPCPRCNGKDRFRVWPEKNRFWCRQCEWSGDSIDLIQEIRGMNFQEAKSLVYPGHELYAPPTPTRKTVNHSLLNPPNAIWCARASEFAKACADRLWSPKGRAALDWLRKRGFSNEMIERASLGLNDLAIEENESLWGLDRDKPVFIDRGIVIPWFIDGKVWRLNIRRKGQPKYRGPAGYSNGLYLCDSITFDCTIVLTEGEFDALSIIQAAPDFVAVSTGTTSGSRKAKWIARLALAQKVLVAFDDDDAGEKASAFWLNVLPKAVRLKPENGKDANQMLQNGCDILRWLKSV